ncbi:Minf_1886 family protein [Tautonia marina]|uniref:Minf_1886 family protein n=1 Tax=Tautonia marina TaxID=2653855 RepID=UPI001F259F7F|nr:Minf_1886 family protein [Tautonia marina]
MVLTWANAINHEQTAHEPVPSPARISNNLLDYRVSVPRGTDTSVIGSQPKGAIMSLREVLAGAVARDPRYSIDAYEFVFAALDLAKVRKRKARRARSRGRKPRGKSESRHVSGRELSEAARDLALDLYGRLALTILSSWGLRSTSDLGEIVYILIASGDLERSDEDQRSDFDNVYDFEAALCHDYVIPIEEPEDAS